MPSDHATSGPGAKTLARAVFWPIFIVAVVVFGFYASQQYGSGSPSVVFITADTTPYWDRVIDGASDAADRYGVDLSIVSADGTMADQNAKIDAAVASGAEAIVISPVDGLRQTGTLREVAKTSTLVTMDSDSELSDRVCFVGMDNYSAGVEAAAMVRRALPNGGRVLIIAGPLDKTNGQERRQGLIDALLGREDRSELNADPIAEPVSGDQFTIVTTLVDELDAAKASSQAAELLGSGEQIDAIVGLYAYHAPAAARAVEESSLGGRVSIVGFDALPETLDLVENGAVFAVIAQDQYGYGFHSVRMAAEAVEGYDNAPLSGKLALPPMRVTLTSLDRIREDMGLKTP